ncbi:AMP-binding protein, partial [Streptomyces boncukensis]|nr:AMP-binding protein [Streptomyces boncukensis]
MATGPPLSALADLLGVERVDGLLRRAAATAPGRTAVRWADGALSYAELDELSDRYAARLRALHGAPPGVVALTTDLDAHFAPAFFGILRSGGVPALVNPLLREDGLAHVLGISAARAAVAPPGLYERLSAVRERLPELAHLVPTHRAP